MATLLHQVFNNFGGRYYFFPVLPIYALPVWRSFAYLDGFWVVRDDLVVDPVFNGVTMLRGWCNLPDWR